MSSSYAETSAAMMQAVFPAEEIRPLLCNGIRYLVILPSVPISYILAEQVEYINNTFGRARHRKLARRAGRTSRTPCSSVSRSHA
jgi:hypothetical protein